MYAVLYRPVGENTGLVIGYLNTDIDDVGEHPHVLLEVEPTGAINPGFLTKINLTTNEFTYEALPALQPPQPSPEIVSLQDESALLALELVDTQIRLEQAENEQASLLLELVTKGVV